MFVPTYTEYVSVCRDHLLLAQTLKFGRTERLTLVLDDLRLTPCRVRPMLLPWSIMALNFRRQIQFLQIAQHHHFSVGIDGSVVCLVPIAWQ